MQCFWSIQIKIKQMSDSTVSCQHVLRIGLIFSVSEGEDGGYNDSRYFQQGSTFKCRHFSFTARFPKF